MDDLGIERFDLGGERSPGFLSRSARGTYPELDVSAARAPTQMFGDQLELRERARWRAITIGQHGTNANW